MSSVVWTPTQYRGYSSQFSFPCTTQQMQNLTDLHAFTRRKILVVLFFVLLFFIYWFLLAIWCQLKVRPKGPQGMNGFRTEKWHPLWSTSVSKLYFWQKNATMVKNIFKKQNSIYKYQKCQNISGLVCFFLFCIQVAFSFPFFFFLSCTSLSVLVAFDAFFYFSFFVSISS